jgi:hypothetical protein
LKSEFPHHEQNVHFDIISLKYDQIKEDELDRACSAHEEMIYAYKIFVGKPEVKMPLRMPRSRTEDNITMYLMEIGRQGAN